MKVRWWMVSAGVIGVLMLMLGIGNALNEEDTGPLYGKLVLLAVMVAGASLILVGLTRLARGNEAGAKQVAFGVIPGSVGIAFFWFPPALLVGVLAIVTSVQAFRWAAGVDRGVVAA